MAALFASAHLSFSGRIVFQNMFVKVLLILKWDPASLEFRVEVLLDFKIIKARKYLIEIDCC